MAIVDLKKFKISSVADSKSRNTLKAGDIVRRQYFDGQDNIYTVMYVESVGEDKVVENGENKVSSYFIGLLLYGDEPKSGEILDFVRVTSLSDPHRSGALYLTSSDNSSPYMDIVDGFTRENAVFCPDKVGSGGYQPIYAGTSIDFLKSDSERYRIAKFTNSGSSNKLGMSVKSDTMRNDDVWLVSFKAKANKSTDCNFVVKSSKGTDANKTYEVTSTIKQFFIPVTTNDIDLAGREVELSFDGLGIKDDYVEISDFVIVQLSTITKLSGVTKVRVGLLDGIYDSGFGQLDGYGGYFQKLFATKDVNVSGTITAGDKDGSGATFYAGKIHKNLFKNSLGVTFTENDALEVSYTSPVGIGNVFTTTKEQTTLIGQSEEWCNKNEHKEVCFSLYVKTEEDKDVTIQSNHDEIFIQKIFKADGWTRVYFSFFIKRNRDVKISLMNKDVFFTAPQMEYGDKPSLYQATDNTLNYTDEYGAWMSRGGFGGTIQNPLLKLGEDGSIESKGSGFRIDNDGTGHLAGGAIKFDKEKVNISFENSNIGGEIQGVEDRLDSKIKDVETNFEIKEGQISSSVKEVREKSEQISSLGNQIKTVGEQASKDAQTAKDSATNAKSSFLSAQEEATRAKEQATNAQTDAIKAKTQAEDAQKKAELASLKAEEALKSADGSSQSYLQAKENAELAKKDALLAKEKAELAQAEAGLAKLDADRAKTEADRASSIKTSIVELETSVTQTAEKVEANATKVEENVSLSNQSVLDAQAQANKAIDSATDAYNNALDASKKAKEALNSAGLSSEEYKKAKLEAEKANADALKAQSEAEKAQDKANEVALSEKNITEMEATILLTAEGIESQVTKVDTIAKHVDENALLAQSNALLAKKNAESAVSSAEEATLKAEEASLKAEEALASAGSSSQSYLDALAEAKKAKADAVKANSDAQKALDEANRAKEEADKAELVAVDVTEKYTSIQQTADEIALTATEVQTNLDISNEAIEKTAQNVADAKKQAESATLKATEANEKALLAQKKADEAKASAGKSSTEYLNAKAEAENALKRANDANAKAKEASESATASKNALTEVKSAQTAINQTAKEITLSAQQVSGDVQKVSDFVDTAKTNADLATAEAIKANAKALEAEQKAKDALASAGQSSASYKNALAEAERAKKEAATASEKATQASKDAQKAIESANKAIEAEASINLKADGIVMEASQKAADKAIDGLEIGGRNLWTNSRTTPATVTIGKYGYSSGYKNISELGLKTGELITFSVYVSNIPDGESVKARIDFYRPDGTYTEAYGSYIVSNEGVVYISTSMRDTSEFDRIRYRVMPVEYTANYQVDVVHEKLERGTKATDWTPAPEDIDAQFTETNSNLSVLSDKIVANTTSIEQTEKRLKTAETTISQQGDQIALKASQKEVDKVSQEVKDNKALIDVNSQGITLAQNSVKEVKDDLDNLEIGGRNLLKDSNKVWKNSSYPTANLYFAEQLKNGERFSIRIYGRLNDNSNNNWVIYNSGGNLGVLTIYRSSYNKIGGFYESTGVWRTNEDVKNTFISIYGIPNSKLENSIDKVMMVRGNKPTDWTPAPEDIDRQFEETEARIDITDGKIDSNTKLINESNTRLSTAETKILQHEDKISLTASKTELDKLTGDVVKNTSAINQNSQGIELSVKSNKELKEEFDNLEIGGRNYFSFNTSYTSDFFISPTTNEIKEESGSKGLAIKISGLKRISIQIHKDGESYDRMAISIYNEIKVGEKPLLVVHNRENFPVFEELKYENIEVPENANYVFIQYGNSNTDKGKYPKKLKIESGSKCTDWSPAPEDIDSKFEETEARIDITDGKIDSNTKLINDSNKRLSTAETKILQHEDKISLTASKTELDKLTGDVVKNTSAINQNSKEIELAVQATGNLKEEMSSNLQLTEGKIEANTALINNTDKKLSDANAKILQQADEIALRATKTEVDKVSQAVKDNKALIDVNSQGITLTQNSVKEVKDDLDNLEIGGRNYILESLVATHYTFTTGFDSKGKWFQFNINVRTITNLDVFEAETSYVLSFEYVAVDGSGAIPYFRIRYTDGTFSPYLANGHSPYVTNANKTVRTVETTYNTSGVVRVYNLKFEKGNKATDWSPAPEDIDSKFEETEARIDITDGKIDSNTKLINESNTRLSTAETKILQHEDKISLTASKTELDKLTGDVVKNTSAINQNSKGIELSVKSNKELKEELDGLEIGGRNYFRTGTKPSEPSGIVTTALPEVYGFKIVCTGGTDSTSRLRNVITSNGNWAVSFYITANVDATIVVDVCDRNHTSFNLIKDQKRRIELTSYNDRYGTVYNFVDFEKLAQGEYVIEYFKTEKGSKATDWTPAPEDIDAQFAENEAKIEVLEGEIKSTVKKNEFDKLTGRVSTAESKITQTEDEIKGLVTKTEFNKETGSLSTEISKISQKSDGISMRVSETEKDLSTVDGRIKDSIDEIEIGGRNLILNSSFENWDGALPFGFGKSANATVQKVAGAKGTNAVQFSATAGGNNGVNRFNLYYSERLLANTNYVLSGWFRRVSDFGEGLVFGGDSWGIRNFPITNTNFEYKEFVLGKSNSSSFNMFFHPLTANSVFEFDALKLEKGNKATDWSPAPEDVVEEAVSKSEAKLTVTANEIRGEVNANKKAADGSISSLNTRVSQTEDKISQTVTKKEYDANNMQVGEKLTKIEQDADGIKLIAKSAEEKIDGLEIGGRNYFMDISRNSYQGNSIIPVDGFYIANAGAYGGVIFNKAYIEEGVEYVLSFEYKTTDNSGWYTLANPGSAVTGLVSGTNVTLNLIQDGVLRKKVIRFTAPTTREISIALLRKGTSGTVYYKENSIKLEKGTIATDWSPAPEDIDAQFAENEAKIEVLEGEIKSTVKKNEFDKLTGRVSTAESKITQTEDEIKGLVTKTEFNKETGSLSTEISKISQKSDGISMRVSETEKDLSTVDGRIKDSIAEIQILKDSITSTVSSIDKLDTRISKVTQESDKFQVEITKKIGDDIHANNENILSSFTVSDNTISMLGKNISLTGKITFNSLDLSTKSKINNALSDSSKALSDVIEVDGKIINRNYIYQKTSTHDNTLSFYLSNDFPRIGSQIVSLSLWGDFSGYQNEDPYGGINFCGNGDNYLFSYKYKWKSDNHIVYEGGTLNLNGDSDPTLGLSLETYEGQDIEVRAVKLEMGDKATAWIPSPEDTIGLASLDETIIDGGFIKTSLIRAGSITADKIDVDNLIGKKLQTEVDGPRIEAIGSELKVYGYSEHPNIIFGIDKDGYSVLKYLNNDGEEMYNLGPNGIVWGSIKPSSFTKVRFYKLSAYKDKKSLTYFDVSAIKDAIDNLATDFYRYFAGSNPTIKPEDREPEKYIYKAPILTSPRIDDGIYCTPPISVDKNSQLTMLPNTGELIQPGGSSSLYQFTTGVYDKTPIYVAVIYAYMSGMLVYSQKVYWNGGMKDPIKP